MPLRPHNNEVDRIATAEGATRLDDILITGSPQSRNKRRPGADTVSRTQPAVRSGRHHAPAQSHASSTLATMRSVEPGFRHSQSNTNSFAKAGKRILRELAASYKRRVQNIRPHAIRSQSEAGDLLVGQGAQGVPLVAPNDARIAQDSLFRVTYLKRSNRKISGIGFPFRQAELDEPSTWRKSRYARFVSARSLFQADPAGYRMGVFDARYRHRDGLATS